MNNQNNKILYGIGGIVIGILLFSVFIPMFRYGGFGMMNWRNSPVADQRLNKNSQVTSNIDRHFIEQMIPHHEGAIDMANLALQKAKRPEIKALAATIIADQTREIQSMDSWYQNWFDKDVPKGNTGRMGGGMMSQGGMHMGGQEDMTSLENAADFDKAFLESMIPHHQLAIMMAQMLENGTTRTEMEQLAKNITSSQTKEIKQMQAWYDVWYK